PRRHTILASETTSSSFSSRRTACPGCSPGSKWPAGQDHISRSPAYRLLVIKTVSPLAISAATRVGRSAQPLAWPWLLPVVCAPADRQLHQLAHVQLGGDRAHARHRRRGQRGSGRGR